MNPNEGVDVKIPANYSGNPVRIIVDKERIKEDKEVTFISFRVRCISGQLCIGDKQIPFDRFYEMLRRRGGLSERVPLIVSLNVPPQIHCIDIEPPAYSRQRVFPFKWNGVACSLIENYCFRFHDVYYETAFATLNDICLEALKLWQDKKSSDEMAIHIPFHNGTNWAESYLIRKKRSFETIYIKQVEKQKIIESISKFLVSSDLYDRYGVTWK